MHKFPDCTLFLHELFLEGVLNGSYQNAITKMLRGYLHGLTSTHDTCYAYVGANLARLNPPDATIRFWGLKSSGLIVHGDAVLPGGEVITDIPVDRYAKHGYEIVREMPFSELKSLAHKAA